MPSDFARFRITYILIAANILFFLFSAFVSGSIVDIYNRPLLALGALNGFLVVYGGEWWRLISAMFLHGGMTHLLMNMFSLYIVGRPMELYFRPRSYLGIYFLSGIIGGMISLIMHPQSVGVGASGAIFGIFGALGGYFLEYRRELGDQAKIIMRDFALIIGINLLLGFSVPDIDVSAHVAGMFTGLIGGFIVARHTQRLWIFLLLSALTILGLYFYLVTGVSATMPTGMTPLPY
jgi:rhomboid protease GluP